MRGLVWDDEKSKNSYMYRLKDTLGNPPFHISLQIEHTEPKFLEQFQKGGWDFVITDLQGKDPSKNLLPSWMADEIVADLRKLGLYVRHDKVFLIYGHDRHAPGLRDQVERFLTKDLSVTVEVIRGGNLRQEILEGLLTRMAECAAFVVLCTPDDQVHDKDGKFLHSQPRQNVLLEMGLAAGMGRGIERLIILQKWGSDLQQQAQFPSDLGGVVPIRLESDFIHYRDRLKEELQKLRIGIRSP